MSVVALIAQLGPRIAIPAIFVGPKVAAMDDPIEIAQTIAFSLLTVTSILTAFQGSLLLSLIPGIAAIAYGFMLRDPVNRSAYRYGDWALTTPLMLLAILLATKTPLSLILLVLLSDVLMIGAGFLGAQATDKTVKIRYFMAGMVLFLPVLYVLLTQKEKTAAILLTLCVWSLYPIVYLLDEQEVIGTEVTNVSYAVMDMVSKIGLVYLLRV